MLSTALDTGNRARNKAGETPALRKLASQVSKKGTSVLEHVRVASTPTWAFQDGQGLLWSLRLFLLDLDLQESQPQGSPSGVQDMREELMGHLGTLVARRAVSNN